MSQRDVSIALPSARLAPDTPDRQTDVAAEPSGCLWGHQVPQQQGRVEPGRVPGNPAERLIFSDQGKEPEEKAPSGREQFTEAISHSRVFALIPPDTLELFAQTTLRPAPNGGYELCCPPEHEAQIFEFYFGWAMQVPDFLVHLDCPKIAIGSDPTSRPVRPRGF